MKTCTKCKDRKEITEFHKNKNRKDGLNDLCKPCARKNTNDYRLNNPEKTAARELARKEYKVEHGRQWRLDNPNYGKEYRENNKDEIRAYLYENKEHIRENSRVKNKERRKKDPAYRAVVRARNRVICFLRNKPKVSKSLGGSFEAFKAHIESLFKPGMSWDNYGKWHLDHYFPLAPAYELGPEVFAKACDYRNIRPEWADVNRSKGDTIPDEFKDVNKFLSSF